MGNARTFSILLVDDRTVLQIGYKYCCLNDIVHRRAGCFQTVNHIFKSSSHLWTSTAWDQFYVVIDTETTRHVDGTIGYHCLADESSKEIGFSLFRRKRKRNIFYLINGGSFTAFSEITTVLFMTLIVQLFS